MLLSLLGRWLGPPSPRWQGRGRDIGSSSSTELTVLGGMSSSSWRSFVVSVLVQSFTVCVSTTELVVVACLAPAELSSVVDSGVASEPSNDREQG